MCLTGVSRLLDRESREKRPKDAKGRRRMPGGWQARVFMMRREASYPQGG